MVYQLKFSINHDKIFLERDPKRNNSTKFFTIIRKHSCNSLKSFLNFVQSCLKVLFKFLSKFSHNVL